MHLVHVQRILFLTVTVPKVTHGPFVSKQHSADIFSVNPYTYRDPGRQPYTRTRGLVKVITQHMPYSPNSAMLFHIRRIQSSNLDPQTSYPDPLCLSVQQGKFPHITSHPYSFHILSSSPSVESWLTRIVTSLSHQWSGLHSSPVHVGFFVDIVALVQVFIRVLRGSLVNVTPQMPHAYISSIRTLLFLTHHTHTHTHTHTDARTHTPPTHRRTHIHRGTHAHTRTQWPVRKANNLTTIMCRCHEVWEP